jgi:hypothetical protein
MHYYAFFIYTNYFNAALLMAGKRVISMQENIKCTRAGGAA